MDTVVENQSEIHLGLCSEGKGHANKNYCFGEDILGGDDKGQGRGTCGSGGLMLAIGEGSHLNRRRVWRWNCGGDEGMLRRVVVWGCYHRDTQRM